MKRRLVMEMSDLWDDPLTKLKLEQKIVSTMGCCCLTDERMDRLLPKGDPWLKNKKRINRILWTLFFLTIVAWVFSIVATSYCTFLIYTPDVRDETNVQGWGLFSEAYYESNQFRGCLSYDETAQFGGSFRNARVFGIFVALCMSASFILTSAMMLFITSHNIRRCCHLLIRIINPAAFVFSCFLFSVFAASFCYEERASCTIGGTGIMQVFNVVVLFIISVMAIICPPPDSNLFIPVWQLEDRTGVQAQDAPPRKALPEAARDSPPPSSTALVPVGSKEIVPMN